jgi:hypothetical protein
MTFKPLAIEPELLDLKPVLMCVGTELRAIPDGVIGIFL